MIRPTLRGQRGLSVLGFDPTGRIETHHIDGYADVLSFGSMKIIPPSVHPCGTSYQWLSDPLNGEPPEALWQVPANIVERLTIALSPWLKRRCQSTLEVPVDRASPVLTNTERDRQARYVEAILKCELAELAAMAPRTGRNRRVFNLVCRLGRWSHAGVLPVERLKAALMDACQRNGLVAEDGARSVLATIQSGLRRSAGDALPELWGTDHG
jgi:hypothetical protein